MKRLLRGLYIRTICLAVGIILLGSCSYSEQPWSSVFVLLDTSGSWFLHQKRKRNNKNILEDGKTILSEVNKAILISSSSFPKPIYYHLLRIADDSIIEPAVCKITYGKKPIITVGIGKKGEAGEDNKSSFEDTLSVCERVARRLRATQFTDITGALELVSHTARNQSYGPKNIIIISDMKEDLPPGSKSSQFTSLQLHGFSVAIVYNLFPSVDNNDSVNESMLEIWRKRLMEAGVTEVTFIHEISNVTDELVRKLRL